MLTAMVISNAVSMGVSTSALRGPGQPKNKVFARKRIISLPRTVQIQRTNAMMIPNAQAEISAVQQVVLKNALLHPLYVVVKRNLVNVLYQITSLLNCVKSRKMNAPLTMTVKVMASVVQQGVYRNV